MCFAGPNALVPSVFKLSVTCASAFFKPRTTATATTAFAGFLDGAAFGTTVDSRSDRWCLYVEIGQDSKGREGGERDQKPMSNLC